MKATINGITVEGTPEEVWAFLQKSNAQGTNLKPVQKLEDWINQQKHGTTDAVWMQLNPKVTCANIPAMNLIEYSPLFE